MTITVNLSSSVEGEAPLFVEVGPRPNELVRVIELLDIVRAGVDSRFLDDFLSDDDNRAALSVLLSIAARRVKEAQP